MKRVVETFVLAFVVAGILPVLHAQDTSKASKPSARMSQVKSEKEYESLPEDATIAMACPKCKSVVLIGEKQKATKAGHGTVKEALVVHKCPGCGGKMTTKPGSKETQMVHVCSECGSGSAYCCSTKDGEKTEGM